ncbi:class I SAM-dependent methyltransferase [Halodesulfovibrio aestuarii]|uniref:Class I SAM-dependent methyltransferase n=1 Tax=Halodesulfovibrio aestuarii TaxID=126333 RepID=A0ABV4JSZ2_9BACT
MSIKSVPTRGRTLDGAASIYDFCEPLLLLGKQKEMNDLVISLMQIEPSHRILDIGCGTGFITHLASRNVSAAESGYVLGIDAAGKMIEEARKLRGTETCRFEAVAAEDLPYEDSSFDSVFSTMFYHHIPLDLKLKSLKEAYRVLKPGGRLVIADMHKPTSFFGALTSHISRWLLFQPQIAENIKGLMPDVMVEAGFKEPELVKTYLGYIAIFSTQKNQ